MPISRRTAMAKSVVTTSPVPQLDSKQTNTLPLHLPPSNLGAKFRAAMIEEDERERLLLERLQEKAWQLAEQAYSQFVAGFRYSAKGNRWRWYGDFTVTVFRYEGGYRYCIAGTGGKTEYSSATYDTEKEAMRDLWEYLQCH